MTTVTSRNGSVEIGPGKPTVLINDQLRVMDQSPDVLDQLKQGRFDKLLELARYGQQTGTHMVDILIAHHDLDEAELLPQVALAVHEEIGCPLSLDTRDPAALEAALDAMQPYKCLLNSVSAETEVLESLLPIAAKYKAAVVGIPTGDVHGLPVTVEGRIAETEVILAAAESYGIPRQDLIIDGLCLASSAVPDSMRITLETLKVLSQDMQLPTILGIANAGFGMPTPNMINLAYLIAAIPWGLHAALVDPYTPLLMETMLSIDFLTNRDPHGVRYIADYRQKKKAGG